MLMSDTVPKKKKDFKTKLLVVALKGLMYVIQVNSGALEIIVRMFDVIF